jgi:serine/threonine protein kinase
MCPEIKQHKKYTFSADIWSIGCVLFEMITLERFYDIIQPSKSTVRFYLLVFKNIKDHQEIFNKLNTNEISKKILKM